MKNKFKVCCFCGKQLHSSSELHNADPLVAPDEEGDFLGCCATCNIEVVQPARKVLWPLGKPVDEAIIPFVRQMSLEELQHALNQDDVLSAFYAFKKKYQKSCITRFRCFCYKRGISFEVIGAAVFGWLTCMITAIVAYVVFAVLLLLILLIKLYSTIVYKAQNRAPKAPKGGNGDGNVAQATVMDNNGAMAVAQPQGLTDELVAVITAAAVACMGNSNIRVTGIRKRTTRSEWSDAALRENVQPFRMGDWK